MEIEAGLVDWTTPIINQPEVTNMEKPQSNQYAGLVVLEHSVGA
jgi:hypothetical protein